MATPSFTNSTLLNSSFISFNQSEPSDPFGVFDVNCAWSISGQYGTLPRCLYYALPLFAVLARGTPWLVAGALASTLKYSGTAAIHAMGIAGYKPEQISGEEDAIALWTILSSCCTRSSTIHKRLDARRIILCWYPLASVGFFCAFAGIFYGWMEPIIPAFDWSYCDPQRPVYFSEVVQSSSTDYPLDPLVFVDLSFISRYNCTNPCSSLGVEHKTQFRVRDDLKLLSYTQTYGNYHSKRISTWVGDEIQTALLTLPIVVCQGLYTLLMIFKYNTKSPREVRNKVFRFLAGIEKLRIMPGTILLPIWRKHVSQAFALLIYLIAIIVFVFCAPMYTLNIVTMELALTTFSESEQPWFVGQWSPIAATGLVLLAAYINKDATPCIKSDDESGDEPGFWQYLWSDFCNFCHNPIETSQAPQSIKGHYTPCQEKEDGHKEMAVDIESMSRGGVSWCR
ncbi:uncharacterized protein PAC_17398 [Phialocephala subalpina]|uniref:Uncharacterized protein n=1 Tax=Phialocephala subalpina TaxID=576137 RepID=A0A1L7XR66_9HELO|nr:uncharacterized protein PAC_17398 [Phialocephala subalpina]